VFTTCGSVFWGLSMNCTDRVEWTKALKRTSRGWLYNAWAHFRYLKLSVTVWTLCVLDRSTTWRRNLNFVYMWVSYGLWSSSIGHSLRVRRIQSLVYSHVLYFTSSLSAQLMCILSVFTTPQLCRVVNETYDAKTRPRRQSLETKTRRSKQRPQTFSRDVQDVTSH